MQNAKINYKIRINKGDLKGKEVEITTDIEELEEEDISSLLIEKDYLNYWCNSSEYTVLSREIIIE